MRRILLAASALLAVSGVTSLGIRSADEDVDAPRLVSPAHAPTTGFEDFLPAAPTTTAERRAAAQARERVLGRSVETPRDFDSSPTTTPAETPPPPRSGYDVDVPAAGVHVSVGDCTDIAITALMPDDCPAKSSNGIVAVHGGRAA